MLVLRRKLEQEIVMRIPGRANPIRVMLVEARNSGKCLIGVDADRDISIDRIEIDEQRTALVESKEKA